MSFINVNANIPLRLLYYFSSSKVVSSVFFFILLKTFYQRDLLQWQYKRAYAKITISNRNSFFYHLIPYSNIIIYALIFFYNIMSFISQSYQDYDSFRASVTYKMLIAAIISKLVQLLLKLMPCYRINPKIAIFIRAMF